LVKPGKDRPPTFGFIVADSIQTEEQANGPVGKFDTISQLMDQRHDIGRKSRGGVLRIILTHREGIGGDCYIEIKTFPAMATGKKQRGISILKEQGLNSSKQGDRNDSMIIGQMIIIAY
jgi:hypothetical protein